jgi:formylglycine-generating enzyme required for sulfatase activity
MMICPACNSELLRYNEHCENCGAPAYLAAASQTSDVTHCTYCGAREESTSNVCPTCGLKKTFKTSESLIGTCRNCGVAWRNTWLYCQVCGVARENGFVDTATPLTVSVPPYSSGVTATSGYGVRPAPASPYSPPREPYESVPIARDKAFPYDELDRTPQPVPRAMLSETEVVERMYVNNDNENPLSSRAELEDFFSESKIAAHRQPPIPPSPAGEEPAPTAADVVYDLPPKREPLSKQTPPNARVAVAQAAEATALPARPVPAQQAPAVEGEVTRAASVSIAGEETKANANPVQTVRFLNKPRASSPPPVNKGLVKTIVLLIGLILLFSALIVSGFRIRDLFDPAFAPTHPLPQTTASPLPAQSQPSPAAPAEMVYIPGGVFRMGSDNADSYESPAHEVTVAPFFMDRTEVSNEQYAAFLKATNHLAPPDWKGGQYLTGADQMPVVNVSWQEANDYAAWAGKRLPTEAEWEFAARTTDGRLYPWGSNWDANKANTNETKRNRPVEVNSHADAANPFGLLNMGGNVWEWTASEVTSYKDANIVLAPGKIIRGGAFYTPRDRATTTFRGFAPPDKQAPGIGFRCVKEVK